MNDRRRSLYAGVAIVAMIGTVAWSASHWLDARDDAARAWADLDSCRLIADRIQQLDRLPRGQGVGPIDPSDLYRRGQQVLQQLSVPPDHLMQIAPGTPQRVGETAYKEVPTQLVIREINLRQLVGFLLAVTNEHSSLAVRNLRLYSPRDSDAGALWTAEITLSYLIYEPPTTINVVNASERN